MREAPEVVELRIHGVGGASPEELLGSMQAADTVRVAGDEQAGFFARRTPNRRVEGYLWGQLNAGAWLQPLWILLLPFTLVNVAGWMTPPEATRPRIERLGNAALFLVGLSLTFLYGAWIADIAIEQVAVAWIFEHLEGISTDCSLIVPDGMDNLRAIVAWFLAHLGGVSSDCSLVGPHRVGYLGAIVAGGAVALGVLAAIRHLARSSFSRYEGSGTAPESEASITGSRIYQGQPGLESPGFWSREADAQRLLVWHLFAWALGVGAVMAWCWVRVKATQPTPLDFGLPDLFVYMLVAEFGVILLLFGLRWWAWPAHLRLALGQLVLCLMALSLANALLYGIGNLIHRRIHAGTSPVPLGIPITAIAVVSVCVALYQWLRHVRRLSAAESAEIGAAIPHPPPGREVGTVPRGVLRSSIRQRHLARVLPELIGVIALWVAVTFAAGLVYLLGSTIWDWHNAFEGFVRQIGAWLLLVGATALLAFIVGAFRRPSDRRPLAIAWDVLAFWPRRFHPFAARAYAERAVPDIEGRLRRHVAAGRDVVVAAHSQGTVLAYATFLRLPRTDTELLRRIHFVTYGSPLKSVYARFFPRYFCEMRFDELRDQIGSPPGGLTAWRNFYRSTDYVGTTVFSSEVNAEHERELNDPPEEPLIDSTSLDQPAPMGPDLPPPPYTKLSIHSRYTSEPAIRQWVDVVIPAAIAGDSG